MKFLFLTLFSLSAVAADLTLFDRRLNEIATAKPEDRDDAIGQILGEDQKTALAVIVAMGPQDPGYFRGLKENSGAVASRYRSLRGETQTGASSGSTGSTSLVLNPYIADMLGISIESGSILKTVSGQTINLQIKPAGIFCGAKDGNGAMALRGSGCMEFWKRVGITAAFDKSRSNAPSQLVALQDDFSEVRVHYDLLAPTIKQAHAALVKGMNASVPASSQVRNVFALPKVTAWKTKTKIALNTAAGNRQAIDKAWSDALDELAGIFRDDPDLRDELSGKLLPFVKLNVDANLKAIRVDQLARTSFALEYALNRADVAKADLANGIVMKGQRPPDLSTARVLYSRNYQPLYLTANAQMSWFNETLPGMNGNFRDWQVSASGTFLLKEIPNFGKTTLGFGGLAGNLHQQPLGFDYTVPLVNDPTKTQKIDLAGTFYAFHTRLEFPTANKSVTIPLSFTWSNRTDLIKEADVRGQIGITIRFDSFFPAP